jgi:hypothetical protein
MAVPAKTRIEAPRSADQEATSAAPSPNAQGWVTVPDGELAGTSAESLALGFAPAVGLNGSEEAQAEAGAEFRNIIDPIINPGRYEELHRAFPRKRDLMEHLAQKHQVHPRTIRRRLEAWEQNGITGLMRKIRADKGSSHVVNQASKNFIIAMALPPESGVNLAISELNRLQSVDFSENAICQVL